MTGTMGKSLGGCRKNSCESNVGSKVLMDMQAAAEVEDILFWKFEWEGVVHECQERESVAVGPIDKLWVVKNITKAAILVPRTCSVSKDDLEHRGACGSLGL